MGNKILTKLDSVSHSTSLGLEELKQIFEALPTALVFADTDRLIIKVNTAFVAMFGYQPEEVYGKHTSMLYASVDDYEEQGEIRFNTAANINTIPYQVKYRRKNGEVFNSETLGTAVKLQSGDTAGMLALITEDDGHLQAIKQLAESELRLRQVFNQQFQFMAVLSPDGTCESVNETALKSQGATEEDYVGLPFWQGAAWRDMPEWESIWKRRLADAKIVNFPILSEDIYRAADGSTRYADASTAAIRNSQGECIRFIVQAVDTTEKVLAAQSLKKQQELTQKYLDTVDAITVALDKDGSITMMNPACEKILGHSSSEFLGKNWFQHCLPQPEGVEVILPKYKEMIDGQLVFDTYYENEVLTADSSKRLIAWNNAFLRDAKGAVIGAISSGQDITDKRAQEEKLRFSASVLQNTSEGVMITDRDAKIIDINKAFTDITGYTKTDVIGKTPSMLSSGRHDQYFYSNLWGALQKTGHWKGEVWNRTKLGNTYPEWLSINGVYDDQEELSHYVAVFSDISHIKQSEDKIAYLSHHDALTDLPNRVLLKERLTQTIKHSTREKHEFAVVMLGLDHFKHINDSFGHSIGDALLICIAEKLHDSLREIDTVARVGGDEFVIIFEEIDQNSLITQLEKTVALFRTPFEIGEHSIRSTVSMGICLYPNDASTTEILLRNADTALSRAKDKGRDMYQFYKERMTHKAFERVIMVNSLHEAIENEQLSVFYQPQICLDTNKLLGLEALVRWIHPTLGIITPDKFIHLAEETGLIHPLGQWVMKTACEDAKKWLELGYQFGRVAINVSGIQLAKGGLDKQLIEISKVVGLQLDTIEIELTESSLMQSFDIVLPQLQHLKEQQVQISIDDFGTGYSSLSYLKELPINKLKIDQSFISDGIDESNKMIVETIISMARNLKLTSLAEGVESIEQAEQLKICGCDQAQGFLYSQPQKYSDITQLIKNYQ